jgi:signal transduction histidine kinase
MVSIAEAPTNEAERLQALYDLDILDTPPEVAFDRITRLAAELFDTPIATISLIAEGRQWLKSKIGPLGQEIPRDTSFCQFTILSDEVLNVPDALRDTRFADNPHVLGDPNIRFYAGAPIRLASGLRMGAMCVIDTKPRPPLTDTERRRLEIFAQIVVDEMELRLKSRQLDEARRAAEAAAQAKSDFLANMSHEFRSPLTSIIGFSGLMLAGGRLAERELSFTQRIQSASQHLLEMVNEVLDYSRLESGHIELNPETVTLKPLLEEVQALFVERAATKGVGLDLRIAPDAPAQAVVDVQALRQILINLVSNAVKFTETGRVSLELEVDRRGRLGFLVRDTGPGIPADRLGRIFERFTQADSSISRNHGGTGLGLAISQHLAELMGASLGVSSTPGVGSVFELRLPAA